MHARGHLPAPPRLPRALLLPSAQVESAVERDLQTTWRSACWRGDEGACKSFRKHFSQPQG